jgi:G-protein coupled receptor 98
LVGDFAISIPPGYGWTIPGPISCGFVSIILIAIIVLHTVYFKRIQLGTHIFIFVLVSIIVFELLSLLNMIVAPLPSTGSNGCIALGILMQLAIVLLFIWMFLLIISLWLNLMGLTNGKEPLIAYIFIGLGLAVAIVVATILIGLYGLSWQLTQLFGKVGEL